jgi:hypothetical protein
MKTPYSFGRTRFFSLARITSASVLLTAAAAMAFVAVKSSSPSWAKSDSKSAINKFSQNRTPLFRNKLAIPGPEREGGPMAAAEEDYANRAGPAPYVPFELTRKAQRAWTNVRSRAMSRVMTGLGPLQSPALASQWTLVGPSSANDPELPTRHLVELLPLLSRRTVARAIATFTWQQLGAAFGERTRHSIPTLLRSGNSFPIASLRMRSGR